LILPWHNRKMDFIYVHIEWNPWLGGYRPQIRVVSALCPQLKYLKQPPKPKKILGTNSPRKKYPVFATVFRCYLPISNVPRTGLGSNPAYSGDIPRSLNFIHLIMKNSVCPSH
jgi:hypothetical protein